MIDHRGMGARGGREDRQGTSAPEGLCELMGHFAAVQVGEESRDMAMEGVSATVPTWEANGKIKPRCSKAVLQP